MPAAVDSWEFPGVVSTLGIDYMMHIMYPELMPDDCSLPLYYSTNLLIYNKDILKKLGFSAPEYGNFKEQQAFLAAITQETAKHKEYYLPGTAQSRKTDLGNYLYEMKDDLFNGISRNSFREKYYDIIFRITDFWKDYPPPEPSNNAAISYDHFIAGKSPFFLSWSVDWIRITETKPDFQGREPTGEFKKHRRNAVTHCCQ